MLRNLAALLALAVITNTTISCDTRQTAQPDGEPGADGARGYLMGISSLPAELTDDGYARAFELAARAGEVVLIKRVPPWAALLSGASFPSESVAVATQAELDLAERNELDIFFAIDFAGGASGPGQIADLPEELRGAGFADARVREAFLAYAQYVAANYRPAYLALGVDVNSYEAENPADFEQFLTLYAEAYDAVKALSPETLAFPTFQLEELHGLLPLGDPRPSQWHLISRFEPRIDVVAVGSYPGLAFSDPLRLPREYFSRLRTYSDRPIVIAETGYASLSPAGENAEAEQAAFALRTLQDAERLDMALVVWFVGHDPGFSGGPAFEAVQHLGLFNSDGSEKAAWTVWEAAFHGEHP